MHGNSMKYGNSSHHARRWLYSLKEKNCGTILLHILLNGCKRSRTGQIAGFPRIPVICCPLLKHTTTLAARNAHGREWQSLRKSSKNVARIGPRLSLSLSFWWRPRSKLINSEPRCHVIKRERKARDKGKEGLNFGAIFLSSIDGENASLEGISERQENTAAASHKTRIDATFSGTVRPRAFLQLVCTSAFSDD